MKEKTFFIIFEGLSFGEKIKIWIQLQTKMQTQGLRIDQVLAHA